MSVESKCYGLDSTPAGVGCLFMRLGYKYLNPPDSVRLLREVSAPEYHRTCLHRLKELVWCIE